MANYIKEKLILIKGDSGEPGDDATDTTVPLNTMFYYDGAEVPAGYEEEE